MRAVPRIGEGPETLSAVGSYCWIEARVTTLGAVCVYRGRLVSEEAVQRLLDHPSLLLLAIGSGVLRRVP